MADDRLERYTQAMDIDTTTNKPMPKVAMVNATGDVLEVTIQGADSAGGSINTNAKSQEYVTPIDIQNRWTKTIQTHNAAPINANTMSVPTTWIDTQEATQAFTEFDITLTNSAVASSAVHLYWSHDGTNIAGMTMNVLAAASDQYRTNDYDKSVKVKARYLKVVPENKDATTQRTMNVSILAKA